MPFWLVDQLPYSLYLELKDQAVNLGNWANGHKLNMGGKFGEVGGDPESDFWVLVKRGKIPWFCKHCLKKKKRGEPCKCEKKSNGSTEPSESISTDALVVE